MIIPVYKVEPYIERCLHTLFAQTLDDIEYIFVDDCTPDESIAIIHRIAELYPGRKEGIRVLSHSENRGLAAARATGLRAAVGEYVISCDPDDYVEEDMYEKLYSEAVRKDVDIVTCYYWFNEFIMTYDVEETPQKCLKAMYRKSGMPLSLCAKLVRREIIEKYDIVPYEDIDFGEDLNCTVRILYYAKSISAVKELLYHYCRREDSLSANTKNLDTLKKRMRNVALICNFLRENSHGEYEAACNRIKLNLKRECQSLVYDNEEEWFNMYRESYRHIFSHNAIPVKSRLVIWLAMRNFRLYKVMKKIFFDI